MQFEYRTKGTCSQRIIFEINDGIVTNVQFLGGCNGNLQGISKLVDGMKVEEVIEKIDHERYGYDGYAVCGLCQTGVPCESCIPGKAE